MFTHTHTGTRTSASTPTRTHTQNTHPYTNTHTNTQTGKAIFTPAAEAANESKSGGARNFYLRSSCFKEGTKQGGKGGGEGVVWGKRGRGLSRRCKSRRVVGRQKTAAAGYRTLMARCLCNLLKSCRDKLYSIYINR